jgi:hypothetical protein
MRHPKDPQNRRVLDPRWTLVGGVAYIHGAQDRLFDRFVPRIRSSAELIAMNSRMPDQDNIQERLKTVQEECRRLREETRISVRCSGLINRPP